MARPTYKPAAADGDQAKAAVRQEVVHAVPPTAPKPRVQSAATQPKHVDGRLDKEKTQQQRAAKARTGAMVK